MRHKYATRGIVLARAPFGEGHARLAIATEELGLIWARAASVRTSKSKLAHALVTFAESELVLVAGAEGWRVAGAVLAHNWFTHLPSVEARERAGRVGALLVRLSPGEVPERGTFSIMKDFLQALTDEHGALAEGAELIAAEGILATFGVGEGGLTKRNFTREAREQALRERHERVARINRSIEASGL